MYIGRAVIKPDEIARKLIQLLVKNVLLIISFSFSTSELLEKRLPPAVPQVRVKSVEVQKINSTFSIELTGYDCAYNYPLFGKLNR